MVLDEEELRWFFDHLKSCHASHVSRRIWLDFDMDIKRECRTEEIFGLCYEALYKAAMELFRVRAFFLGKIPDFF